MLNQSRLKPAFMATAPLPTILTVTTTAPYLYIVTSFRPAETACQADGHKPRLGQSLDRKMLAALSDNESSVRWVSG